MKRLYCVNISLYTVKVWRLFLYTAMTQETKRRKKNKDIDGIGLFCISVKSAKSFFPSVIQTFPSVTQPIRTKELLLHDESIISERYAINTEHRRKIDKRLKTTERCRIKGRPSGGPLLLSIIVT